MSVVFFLFLVVFSQVIHLYVKPLNNSPPGKKYSGVKIHHWLRHGQLERVEKFNNGDSNSETERTIIYYNSVRRIKCPVSGSANG